MTVAQKNQLTINKGFAELKSIIRNRVIEALALLGERSIEHMLGIGGSGGMIGYTNRTFNLHDSYGYGVYENGIVQKIKMVDPKATTADSMGGKGSEIGEAFLESYVPRGNGWSLIVTAGEFYADWLQNVKNLDVLTGAYQYADDSIEVTFLQMPRI